MAGRDLRSVANDIEKTVKERVAFGQGYHPEFLGEYEEATSARQRILVLSIFSTIAIFLLLYADFQALRPALLIFLTLPFALDGGIAGAFLCGGVISLGSLIGFVRVLGVAARNGIMMISHYRHLETAENVPRPGRQYPGSRNRVSDGVRDSGRIDHIDTIESAGGPHVLLLADATHRLPSPREMC